MYRRERAVVVRWPREPHAKTVTIVLVSVRIAMVVRSCILGWDGREGKGNGAVGNLVKDGTERRELEYDRRKKEQSRRC